MATKQLSLANQNPLTLSVKSLFLFASLILLFSCKDDEEVDPDFIRVNAKVAVILTNGDIVDAVGA